MPCKYFARSHIHLNQSKCTTDIFHYIYSDFYLRSRPLYSILTEQTSRDADLLKVETDKDGQQNTVYSGAVMFVNEGLVRSLNILFYPLIKTVHPKTK